MGEIIATIASIGIRNFEHRLFTWGGAGGPYYWLEAKVQCIVMSGMH